MTLLFIQVIPSVHEEVECYHSAKWRVGEVAHDQSDILHLNLVDVKYPVGVSGMND